ncbi:MAG TPA: hypothetical protein VHZ24_13585 [Pirellulales bacterium]|jgi:hypothetical protein|nr:hypothetical protein [Pirellulales bacterium]
MVDRPLRFLHTSDLRLDSPLEGASQVPAALRELFRDAPLLAARRLFDHAVAQRVDFIVLAGNVIDLSRAGPSELALLVEQFQRLAAEGIAVYWAGGATDSPEAWPTSLPLPPSVKRYPRGRCESFTHCRADGGAIASIIGYSTSAEGRIPLDIRPSTAGLPSIAVVPGEVDTDLSTRGIDYVALGSRSGSPQGRSPGEPGLHGAALVEIEVGQPPRMTPLDCDVVRWCDLEINAGAHTGREPLERLLAEHAQRLVDAGPGRPLLASWRIAIQGPVPATVHRSRLAADLLAWLRAEYGQRVPPIWSVSLVIDTAAPRSTDFRSDSVVSHYLGELERLAALGSPSAGAALVLPIVSGSPTGELHRFLSIADPPAWDDVVREAALLGTDLLTAEEDAG